MFSNSPAFPLRCKDWKDIQHSRCGCINVCHTNKQITLSLVTFLMKPSVFLASQCPRTLSWWFQRHGKADPEILFLTWNTSSALFLLNMTLHWRLPRPWDSSMVPCYGHRIWLPMKSSVSPVSLEASQLPFLSRPLEGDKTKLFPTPIHASLVIFSILKLTPKHCLLFPLP